MILRSDKGCILSRYVEKFEFPCFLCKSCHMQAEVISVTGGIFHTPPNKAMLSLLSTIVEVKVFLSEPVF